MRPKEKPAGESGALQGKAISERGHSARSTAGIEVVEVVMDDGRLSAGYGRFMVKRTVRAIGIPWYRREDWDTLRALFIDAAKLPATYDKWLRKAEHAEKQFKRRGSLTDRVYLDPIEFSLWCVDRGTDLDAAARMNFACRGCRPEVSKPRLTARLYIRR